MFKTVSDKFLSFKSSVILKRIRRKSAHQEKQSVRNIILKQGGRNVVYSIGLVLGFVLLDFLLRLLYGYIQNVTNPFLESFWIDLDKSLSYLSIQKMEFFVEVINISAGLFGILLGLLFTSFYTIIATKYANSSSTVRSLIINQKPIRYYFDILSILTAVSILFQFSLALGYKPTIISVGLFLLAVLFSLLSFTKTGLQTTAFLFDRVVLANDVLNDCQDSLDVIIKHQRNIELNELENTYLNVVLHNLENFEILLSDFPENEIKKTTFNQISTTIHRSLIYYNNVKHRIPTTEKWQIKKREFKTLEEASSHEWDIAARTGTRMNLSHVSDEIWYESRLLKSYFDFLRKNLNDQTNQSIIESLFIFQRYSEVIAWQWEDELYQELITLIDEFGNEIIENEISNKFYSAGCSELMGTLLITHFVGVNNCLNTMSGFRFEEIYTKAHDGKIDKNLDFIPFTLRLKLDKYIERRIRETDIEGKAISPLWYTKSELSIRTCRLIFNYYDKIVDISIESIEKNVEKWTQLNKQYYALHYLLTVQELSVKMSHFLGTVKTKITELEGINRVIKDQNFNYESIDKKINYLYEMVQDKIWELGRFSFDVEPDQHSDIHGEFYKTSMNNLIQVLVKDSFDEESLIAKYTLFVESAVLYILKIESRNSALGKESVNQKQYAFVKDVLDISSMVILVGIVNNLELIDKVKLVLDNSFSTQKEKLIFWKNVFEMRPFFATRPLATNSYEREKSRKDVLTKYLIRSGVFVENSPSTEDVSLGLKSFTSSVDNKYLKEIVRTTRTDYIPSNFDLDEILFDSYLVGNPDFSELTIKTIFSE